MKQYIIAYSYEEILHYESIVRPSLESAIQWTTESFRSGETLIDSLTLHDNTGRQLAELNTY